MAVLAFTACSDKNPYAGKYSGTYTFVTDKLEKSGNMRITSNPLSNGLLIYAVVPVDFVEGTTYRTNSVNAQMITQLLQLVGNNNNIYNSATEQIKNVAIEAKFSGNTVYVDMYYTLSIMGTELTRVSIVKFVGTK